MIEAGADVICVNLGLTKGGFLGPKRHLSIEDARRMTDKIYALCNEMNPDIMDMNSLVDSIEKQVKKHE